MQAVCVAPGYDWRGNGWVGREARRLGGGGGLGGKQGSTKVTLQHVCVLTASSAKGVRDIWTS